MIPNLDGLSGILRAAARDEVEGFNQDYHFGLLIEDFTPGLDLSGIAESALGFDEGLAAKPLPAITRGWFIDPSTGEQVLRFVHSTGTQIWGFDGTDVPFTVYGMWLAIGDGDGATYPGDLRATYKFPTPIEVTSTQQAINLPPIEFRMLPGSIV